MEDQLLALDIYGGEEIESLLEHLPDPDIRLPAGVTEVNDFHSAFKKLDNYFVGKINKDSARFKFDNLTQGEQSMAKYYIELKKRASKCQFADAEDTIRTKILLTMKMLN